MNNVTERFELPNCKFGSKTDITYNDIQQCKLEESIIIPSNVTDIADFAFIYSSLKEIKFAEKSKLATIGHNAFDSTKLKSITIPSSVNYIYDYAFASCSDLTEVIFEKRSSAISIAGNAFYDCKNIKTVKDLPNYPYSLEKIFNESKPTITIYSWINIQTSSTTTTTPTITPTPSKTITPTTTPTPSKTITPTTTPTPSKTITPTPTSIVKSSKQQILDQLQTVQKDITQTNLIQQSQQAMQNNLVQELKQL